MEHIAILKKSWGFLHKILTNEKMIESRWYKSRTAPWGRIKPGETVYFKETGEPVTVKAQVEQVIQISDLDTEKIRWILEKYGNAIGIAPEERGDFIEEFQEKRYCILIFLKEAQPVKPFEIDKSGFGTMSAWLTVDNVERIKIPLAERVESGLEALV